MTKSKAKKSAAKKAVVIVEKKKGKKPEIAIVKGAGDYKVNRFTRVAGKGDYFSDLGGSLLGGLGKAVGSGLGGLVGGALKSITGMGDYREKGPRSNSLWAGGRGSAMNMGEMGAKFAGGPPRVQHREFIGPVLVPSNPAAFNTTQYYIQPGLRSSKSLFPWLSSVAQCFQQYKMHGMILEYVSSSADYASQSALGEVMLSTLYDAGATPLANQAEVLNNEYTTVDKPCNSFIHPIECATKDSPVTVRYIRAANSVDSADERLDDVGLVQISTSGLTATAGTELGQLWCIYDVELLKPQLPDLHIGTTAHAEGTFSMAVASNYSPFAGMTTPVSTSSLPITINVSTQKIMLPVGYAGNFVYLHTWLNATASNGVWQAPGVVPLTCGADVTPLNMFPSLTATSGASFYNCGPGVSGVSVNMAAFAFQTVAESTANNYIQWPQTFTSQVNAVSTINHSFLILPIDNNVLTAVESLQRTLSNKFGVLPPGMADALMALCIGAQAQCSASSVPASVGTRAPCSSVDAGPPYELGPSSSASALSGDRPGTPRPDGQTGASTPIHVETEYGLDQSVHISRSKLASLLSGLKGA